MSTNPIFLAIISAFISSIGTVFSRIALNDIPVLWATCLVPLFGGLILACFILPHNFKKVLLLLCKKEVLFYAAIRTLGAWIFVEGASRTSATNAVFLTKIEPYCVLLWLWILSREKVQRKEFFLLLIHVLGAIILSNAPTRASTSSVTGDSLLVLSMLISGYSYHLGKNVLTQHGTKLVGTISLLFTGIIVLLFAILFEKPLPSFFEHQRAYGFLGLQVITFTAMYFCWLLALTKAPGWKISALRALGPLAGIPVAWFLLDEPLSPFILIGGALVVGTSFVLSRR